MPIHIIIDGYNLIRQSSLFSDIDRLNLQRGREMLLEYLADYRQRRHHRVTVVFDGAGAPSFSPPKDRFRGVDIRFSRSGETADAVIKKMTSRLKEKALVVSSDREIIDHAVLKGAATIRSPEFEKIVLSITGEGDRSNETGEDSSWTPTTKKKGPRRRLPRNARRSRLKILKL